MRSANPEQTRAKMREAYRRRVGLPPYHCQLYGVVVRNDIAAKLRPWAKVLAAKAGYRVAQHFIKRELERYRSLTKTTIANQNTSSVGGEAMTTSD